MANDKEIDISEADTALVELVTKAEYDIQIATARKYPRSIKQFMNSALEMVTLNEQVADECIYALPRDGKTIEGPSARFAELVLSAWGHARAGARIVNEDGRFITAQGVCHDLQSNTLIAYEVRRRITNKHGKKYNDDMIGVTGNAASSIALRNAILKVVPKVFWGPLYEEARKVVMGDARTLANRRAAALEHLQKFGATQEMVLKKLEVKGVEDITLDHLVVLRGMVTAMKDGDTTVEQLFAEPNESTNRANALKDKIAKRTGKDGKEELYNEETGEVVEAAATATDKPEPSPSQAKAEEPKKPAPVAAEQPGQAQPQTAPAASKPAAPKKDTFAPPAL